MRRFCSTLLALSSLLPAGRLCAAARPRYGGTLHVAMRASPASLDPASPDGLSGPNLSRVLFDTLVAFDDRGALEPALAASWQAESGNQRWRFYLRPGVTFSDRTRLTPELAAASLRTSNPHWRVLAAGDAVEIETDSADPYLAAELALPENSIVRRQGKQLSGTGPFVALDWQAGRKLSVGARDDYWGGRPYLDAVEFDFGMSLREQAISLELRKAQIVEFPPLERPAAASSYHVDISAPVELMALVFPPGRLAAGDAALREVLSLSIDRRALNNVVLQGGGEPTGALLPNWMTGYQFLFPREPDLARARQQLADLPRKKPWTLGYDDADPIARVLAERIVLNARDAGMVLGLSSGNADLRLVRIPLACSEPHLALARLAETMHMANPKFAGDAVEDLYRAESSLLESRQAIPLVHLRTGTAVGSSVRDWAHTQDGSWRLPQAWLEAENAGANKP